MATRKKRAVTRKPLVRCSLHAVYVSASASGKRHLLPGWSEKRTALV